MKNLTLSKRAGSSTLARAISPAAECKSVRKLSRFTSILEPLENRTMMSVTPMHHLKTPTPVLTVPSTLTISSSSASSIKLAWNDSDTNATGYKILRSTGSGAFAQVAQITSRTVFNYVDAAVTPNTTYSYKIEASSASTLSGGSSIVTIKTAPLASPSGLAATVGSSSKIILNWTDNDSSAAGYYILRSTNGGGFAKIWSLTSKSAVTFTDSSVNSGHSYQYEVEAYLGASTSAVSTAASAVTPLAAPAGLSSTVQSSSQIQLSWTNKDSSATGYMVLRSTDDIHFTTLGTLSTGDANSMNDKTVAPFTTYYYEVVATSASAKSMVSNIASSATPLAVPTGAVAAASGSGIKLTWSDSDPAAKGFVILRSANQKIYTQVGQTTFTSNWTDSTVTADTGYTYEIQAVNGTAHSAVTTPVSVTTPMSTPTGLTATLASATSIKLSWTDTDSTATQYTILRSTNGAAFTTLATVKGGSATSFTDSTTAEAHSYSYEIAASSGAKSSGSSVASTVITPLVAPSNLIASTTPANTVVLTWTNNDSVAIGYNIFRSTDGVNFTLLSKPTGYTTSTFTDTSCGSGHTYFYQVQAYGTFGVSPATNSATVTTALLTPAGITATVVGTTINLAWINKDSQSTGYIISRSTDGVYFTKLAQLTSASVQSYVDQSVTAGQKYYYEVQAVGTVANSAVSAAVSVTMTGTLPAQTSVTITTRYGNELVITATGSDDTVSVTQSGSTLTITADGQTTTQPVPAAGLFIYTRGGTDGINVASSVTVRTTIETIDSAVDDIDATGTNVSVWDDSNDVYTGTATVHTVNTFAGGVAKTADASLADPSDAGTTMHATGSLWGTGPVVSDVNQGASGDCYFLSSLAAFAGENPKLLQESAVDMGDGTYAVQFISSNGSPEFVRVNNDISTYGGGSYVYARPGSTGSLWAAIMEKAFSYFRTGANTYASIDSGWMGEIYADLGVNSSFFYLSSATANSLYNTLSSALASGKEVTLGTGSSAPQLVSGHAYTLISCSINSSGVATYVVRNPWGVSGDSLENSQGYATLTFAQMQANFEDCCVAT